MIRFAALAINPIPIAVRIPVAIGIAARVVLQDGFVQVGQQEIAGERQQREQRCNAHDLWSSLGRQMIYFLSSISLEDVVEKRGGKLSSYATRAPRFVRLGFFGLLRRNPPGFKRLSGTVIVTSVGMFGRGGGWGLGFLPLHTLGLTVGGIASKPAVHEGEIVIREFLNLTVSFDHDIVDGAPAARFVQSLAVLVEGASALEPEQAEPSSEAP